MLSAPGPSPIIQREDVAYRLQLYSYQQQIEQLMMVQIVQRDWQHYLFGLIDMILEAAGIPFSFFDMKIHDLIPSGYCTTHMSP